MKNKRKKIGMLVFLVIIVILMVVTSQTSGTISDAENYQCKTYATLFSLLPPVIAIGLALITKECIRRFWQELLQADCYIPISIWN